ncbi:rod shape-determining protein MreD [Novosphingobium capsulatum]|uniref:Rod shape-determining protein MreD n=1 Tax=Novosphingobium capsulatum TaxID=13688 RepID=A0ABU1MGM7_9SPHN|nr:MULTISPECIES: rod shape-determining protein MreD [Novosphingobium]KPF55321.1 rod shape-determining protein MreD [Novosphingobium sp. AAP1]MBB3358470.1 rod shape-determining protein MreD [Novosphingobium sp. BK256]MBB3374831.1 rod shape-determining protein MreD [Novosphingobium sp. BK280]MBB3379480.1 rod shape-determining protein MreD [Novosphingobium sp. BK258]MBB3421175.1 rod shape-determining protein MreD [Novosphingobium sp. BK267]
MPLPFLPARPEDLVRRRLNRGPLPFLAKGLPWLSIMLASMVTFSPVVASAPVLPPLGFMTLLGWRLLRPTLLPIWAGLPLGLFDDLYSGQPFGSGIVLWSLTMLAMDVIDEKFLWRGFIQDWLTAATLLSAYVVLTAAFAGLVTSYPLPVTVGPQVLLTVLLHPVVTRIVALLDRIRLLPLKRL